jgi:hypothetical protein
MHVYMHKYIHTYTYIFNRTGSYFIRINLDAMNHQGTIQATGNLLRYVCMCICIHECICMYVYMCCVCLCMYVCVMYTYMYVCVYVLYEAARTDAEYTEVGKICMYVCVRAHTHTLSRARSSRFRFLVRLALAYIHTP